MADICALNTLTNIRGKNPINSPYCFTQWRSDNEFPFLENEFDDDLLDDAADSDAISLVSVFCCTCLFSREEYFSEVSYLLYA